MAKLSLTRFLEISRFLATDAGKQLADFITYVSDFAEQTLRALRNGLTFQDNFNSSVITTTLKHATAQPINTNNRQPYLILHATQSTTTAITSLVWAMNESSQLIVTPEFKGNPSDVQTVVLVIFFK